MGLLFWQRDRLAEPLDGDHPAQLIERAKDGDVTARNRLIEKFQPFVLSIASRVSGRFVQAGRDDEVSIGLLGFNEAIDSYDPAKGVSFLGFAEMVMRRRLIDHFRKEGQRREVPLTGFDEEDDEGQTYNAVQSRRSVEEFSARGEAEDRHEEILRYQKRLQEYGISLQELVSLTPKHEDARRRAMEAAQVVASKPEYRAHLARKGELPLKLLEADVQVSRKTLERQRKYIIAIALALMDDFVYLRDYISRQA
ncbi:MAG: RNA polymerase sigma factor SigI [Symbiobacteriia bacterium]